MALDNAFQNLQLKKTSAFNVLFLQLKNVEGFPCFLVTLFCQFCFLFKNTEKLVCRAEDGNILRSCRDSQHTLNLEGWKGAWHTVESLYIKAVNFGNTWKDDKSSYRKRKAFDELLNLFRDSGLTSYKVGEV